MIPIKIKTTGGITLSEEVRAFLDEKVQKLLKLVDPNDTTMLAEIELEARPPKMGAPFRAEINFSSNGKVLRVEADGPTLHASIDGAVEEAKRRLRHLKGKHTVLARRGAKQLKDFFRNFPGF